MAFVCFVGRDVAVRGQLAGVGSVLHVGHESAQAIRLGEMPLPTDVILLSHKEGFYTSFIVNGKSLMLGNACL